MVMRRIGTGTFPANGQGSIPVIFTSRRINDRSPRVNVVLPPASNLAHSKQDRDMKHLAHYLDRPAARGRMAALASPRIAGAGIALAAAALFVAFRSRKAERDYPPEGKFVEVDGVRLHCLEKAKACRWCYCPAIPPWAWTSPSAAWSTWRPSATG